jgi:hypothetical protein
MRWTNQVLEMLTIMAESSHLILLNAKLLALLSAFLVY